MKRLHHHGCETVEDPQFKPDTLDEKKLSPATELFILEATALIVSLQTNIDMLRLGHMSLGDTDTLEDWLARRFDHFP